MPRILRPLLYTAIFSTAKTVFASPAKLSPYVITKSQGDPLYRYVNYRNFQPQQAQDALMIWTQLPTDINNRWTGMGSDGSGWQGLYTSGESVNTEKPFPELEHYQDLSVDPNQEIAYFKYAPKTDPSWTKAKASELRSMFLFTANMPLKGVDLSLMIAQSGQPPVEHPLLKEILETAKSNNPGAFIAADTLQTIYSHPDDASFTRAVGNGFYAATGDQYDFFQTTSVRNQLSTNVILRGETGKPIGSLEPEGRATFYLDDGGKCTGVFTIPDMLYNAELEKTGLGQLPTQSTFVQNEAPFKTTIEGIEKDDIDWDLAANNIDNLISKGVSDVLSKTNNPFANSSIDDLVGQMSTQTLKDKLRQQLSDFVLSEASTSQGYSDLFNQIGIDGIQSLISDIIVEPRYDTLVNATDSYLDAAVKKTLLENKSHWLSQNQSQIQQDLAKANTTVTDTSTELESKQTSLKEIEQQLQQQPDNPTLKQQQGEFNQEIAALVDKQQKAEAEQANLKEEKRKNDADMEEIRADKEQNDQEWKERRAEAFGE